MARRATYIKQAQAENLLVLDAGDSLIGDRAPAKTTQGRTSVEAMNMMGYDALALALRDASLGVAVLKQRIAEAKFAVLSANLIISGTSDLLTMPYIIKPLGANDKPLGANDKPLGEHSVAIIGLTEAGARGTLQASDPLETMLHIMPEVETQADIVILLSHAGWTMDQQIAKLVPNIDLIISGGTEKLQGPIVVQPSGTLLVRADVPSPGHAGRYVGNAQLQFDGAGKLTAHQWKRVKLDPNWADDPEVAQWAKSQR